MSDWRLGCLIDGGHQTPAFKADLHWVLQGIEFIQRVTGALQTNISIRSISARRYQVACITYPEQRIVQQLKKVGFGVVVADLLVGLAYTVEHIASKL